MGRVLPCLLLFATACGGGVPAVPMPLGLALATPPEGTAWAASTRPSENREIRFRLQFRAEEGAVGGRGRLRYALPDSVRLDATGSLGSFHASALVVGDTALWADPEKDVQKLVPNYPLFWAMLGIARPPAEGTTVRKVADGIITAWQFVAGGDTVQYVRETGARNRLIAEVRQRGKQLGQVETKFGPDGLPLSTRLIVPGNSARLDLTFYQNEKARPFAPDTWIRPAAPPER